MKNDNTLFILAGNGPYDNRGCEAIAKGTIQILRQFFNDPTFLLVSNFQNEMQYKLQCKEESDERIIHIKTRTPISYIDIKGMIHLLFGKAHADIRKNYIYHEMLPYIKLAKAVLSIGGDNYSLDYGIPQLFTDLDDTILKYNKKVIIWGASIGPFSDKPNYENYMIKHLQKIDGIFVRESATIEYLKSRGLDKNIIRVSDPAFLLRPKKPNNDMSIRKNALGVNLSPLMAKYITNGDINIWAKLCAETISLITERYSLPIYMIPHVTSPHSNDFTFMKNVLDHIKKGKENICLIDPIYDASETKWIISQMKIFAGSRTHANIAALSSCVPTLSFAYSIKAKGITRDMLNNDRLCIGPDKFRPEIICNEIGELINNYNEIKNLLKKNIPQTEQNALTAGKHLKNLLE